MNNIKEKIRTYIAREIMYNGNNFPYQDTESFLEVGILDSTNVLELVMYLEESFGITVQDVEIVPSNFDSVENLATYIQQKLTLPAD